MQFTPAVLFLDSARQKCVIRINTECNHTSQQTHANRLSCKRFFDNFYHDSSEMLGDISQFYQQEATIRCH